MRAVSLMIAALVVFLIVVVGRAQGQLLPNDDNVVLRWASTGGGWLTFVANLGYANVFAQAGLFGDEPSSSKFSAMSGLSGSTWFMALFFYSIDFYEIATQSTPAQLSQTVLDMVDAYSASYIQTIRNELRPPLGGNDTEVCELFSILRKTLDSNILDLIDNNCASFQNQGGGPQWATVFENAMVAATEQVGAKNISSCQMTRANRVAPLASTDMYLQTAMLANSRIRTNPATKRRDKASHIGPAQGQNTMYSVAIAVQWSVSDDYETYISNTPYANGTGFPSEMVVYKDKTPREFFFDDWKDHFLNPEDAGTALVDIPSTASLKGPVRAPFGGVAPTVIQMETASSAALGFISPLAPSTFAQALSSLLYDIVLKLSDNPIARRLAERVFDVLYQLNFWDEAAVCSQWPIKDCGMRDVRFGDGFIPDLATVPLSIGQYQTIQNGDLSKTIKLVLVPPNDSDSDDFLDALMWYFKTPANQFVKPGDFFWPKGATGPQQSTRIFANYLDLEMYKALLEPLDDIQDLKTARIRTTTVENPTYLVKAGQPVDILIMQLNTLIPWSPMDPIQLQIWKQPLADLVEDIASSSELVQRVQDFVAEP